MLNGWLGWVIVGLLLALMELLGAQFVFLAIGVSCLSGAVVAGFTDYGFKVQLAVTIGSSFVFIPLFIYWFKTVFKATGRSTIGEGAEALHLHEVIEQQGRLGVKIQGDFFPARHIEGETLVVGMSVRVLRMDGITALVTQV